MKLTRQQELIAKLNEKYEAIEFWTDLKDVVPIGNKLLLLQEEVNATQIELNQIRRG